MDSKNLSVPHAAFIAEFGEDAVSVSQADCADPVADLERFCAELGRELATVQRERARLYTACYSIAHIMLYRDDPDWRVTTLDVIALAKAALENNKQ